MLSTFDFLNSFLAVFLLGESAVITFVVAAKQGFFDFQIVIIASFLGAFSADIFWLLVGRYMPQRWIPKKIKKHLIGPINTLLEKLVDKNLFLTFVFLKFLITVRLPLLLHLSKYNISWFKLLAYDFIGNLIFIFTLTVIAIEFESYISENIRGGQIIVSILSAFVFVFIISRLLLRLFIRWTLKQ